MSYVEKTMKSDKIYEGKILNLRIDTVELPDKKYSKREIVEHSGAVAIVPITDDGYVTLVKQYRKAIDKELLEIPAGKIEVGEEPKSCAIRELKEETGITAENLEYMFEFYTSPGFSNEKLYLFMAKNLNVGEANPDTDEYIEVVKIKLEDLVEKVNKGEIQDSKTIVGILTAYQMKNK
ncbi:MAG: NUDIX hydrolase [Firmicutes bacterium]|nr:NUDIX hydrolase [Bacillota bacterium]